MHNRSTATAADQLADYRLAQLAEWRQQLISTGNTTGHEFNWPQGITVCRSSGWNWNDVTAWLEQHVGTKHQDWTVGRFEILFQRETDLLQFVLTWC